MSRTALLHRYTDWELRLAIRLNQANHRALVSGFFGLISRLGDGMFWYGLMLALLFHGGLDGVKPVLVMATAGLGCTWLYTWIKSRTSRPRPCQAAPTIRLTTLPLDRFSFPSGHTLHAVCFSLLASHFQPPLMPFLLPFAGLVATSRLILGLHWFSDVLAGAALGGTMAALAILVAG